MSALPCSSCKAECCYSPAVLPSEARVIETKYPHLKLVGHPFQPHIKTLGEAAKKCPALVKNRCSIYEDRPAVCHQFGLTQNLPCPKVKRGKT